MTWANRLLDHGAYVSPSGERIEFDYEDISLKLRPRRAAFDFTGENGTYVQTNGYSGRVFPMDCIFAGPECDVLAKKFGLALLEDGVGKLEHPLHGSFPAVAVGEIGVRDKVVSEANQTIVTVTFFRTLRRPYPTGQADELGALSEARTALATAAADEYSSMSELATTAARENASATVSRLLVLARGTLGDALADSVSEARALADGLDAIDASLGTLIGSPTDLAAELFAAIGSTVDAAGFASALNGLGRLLDGLLADPTLTPSEYAAADIVPASQIALAANAFHVARVFASAAVSSSAAVAVRADYRSRDEALREAVALAERFDAVVAWSEAGIASLEQVDTGAAYQQMQSVVAGATGYLVRVSFNLAVRRTLTTTRYRTLLDVASEVYGEVDARLDELIADNDLTGDQILEIEPGTVLVYYA